MSYDTTQASLIQKTRILLSLHGEQLAAFQKALYAYMGNPTEEDNADPNASIGILSLTPIYSQEAAVKYIDALYSLLPVAKNLINQLERFSVKNTFNSHTFTARRLFHDNIANGSTQYANSNMETIYEKLIRTKDAETEDNIQPLRDLFRFGLETLKHIETFHPQLIARTIANNTNAEIVDDRLHRIFA